MCSYFPNNELNLQYQLTNDWLDAVCVSLWSIKYKVKYDNINSQHQLLQILTLVFKSCTTSGTYSPRHVPLGNPGILRLAAPPRALKNRLNIFGQISRQYCINHMDNIKIQVLILSRAATVLPVGSSCLYFKLTFASFLFLRLFYNLHSMFTYLGFLSYFIVGF